MVHPSQPSLASDQSDEVFKSWKLYFSNEETEMRMLSFSAKWMALILVVMLLGAPAVMADVGGMWHTIRAADGNWLPFGDVKSQASDPGAFFDVSIAGNDASGELHVVGETDQDGNLWHTIRAADGNWLPFGDVKAATGTDPGYLGFVATAVIGGNLHVVAQSGDGNLWHTIRAADGSWQPFGDVKAATGTDPGYFGDVSISGNNASGELHVVGQTNDGNLWHTIRAADGRWQPFGDVKAATGTDPGYVGFVATALIGGNLHLVGETDQDGNLWHTIRAADGSWLPFGDVKVATGTNPGFILDVSIASNNASGELHVVGATNDGDLWHTIRAADGNWQPFGDVKAATGTDPGYLGFAATAVIGGNLHLVGTTQ
jgi:hypothetical protein